MKKTKVWRYQCECDFCGKKNFSPGHMANHEKHCTKNPDRECRLCEAAGLVQEPFHNLQDAFVRGGLGRLREVTENCPICILATLRSFAPPKGEYWEDFAEETASFNYKKELQDFWDEVNAETCYY